MRDATLDEVKEEAARAMVMFLQEYAKRYPGLVYVAVHVAMKTPECKPEHCRTFVSGVAGPKFKEVTGQEPTTLPVCSALAFASKELMLEAETLPIKELFSQLGVESEAFNIIPRSDKPNA